MIDLMLRFETEQDFIDFLSSQNMVNVDDDNNITPICFTHDYAMDIIGIIPPDTGYHTNLRIISDDIDITPFQTYSVTPNSPYRVWV